MEIRAYQQGDEPEVVRLWEECGLTTPSNNPRDDIARKLKVDADLFLVGTMSGKVIATIMGGYEGHRGWINYLAVEKSQRRQGYALKMMQAVELLLTEKGCPKINLQVRKSNEAAVSFYQKLGYLEDSVISLGKRLK